TLGLKLDWSSGDQNLNDGRIGSFNPMYVNPSIYSLALINVPVNLLSLHPSFTVFPSRKLMVQVEYVVFGRSSKNDGLYAPSNRQSRTAADGVSARYIGNSVGLFVVYNYNRSFSFNLRTSYFQAGDFIEQTGPSESVFQFSPTLTFSF
ncbi:MAG: alginate export family protein, partial [Bacteroidota bacterium]